MTSKVVILTAGAGSRLNERTKYFNKALLKVGNKAAISHIIGLFPAKTEFVIALGHLGSMVQQYLALAHPDNCFTYVEIDKYSVPGSGPAYALNKCKEHLQEPFFFVACDTIIESGSFHSTHKSGIDYLVYDTIEQAEADRFCTLRVANGQVLELLDKLPNGTDKAFTGFAHIQSWKRFWRAMEANHSLIYQELQLSPALAALPAAHALKMKWHDVGSEHGLLSARAAFDGIENLDKLDEELYVVNNQVVKYFYNEQIVKSRVWRTEELADLVPKLTGHSANFYRYNFVYGDDMFQRGDIVELMPSLLSWASKKLWRNVSFDEKEFRAVCFKFYYVKTIRRIEQFFEKTSLDDLQEAINGEPTQRIGRYLDLINWQRLCEEAIPSGFHGDFQPANIVVDYAKDFKLIDWRQDFGGLYDCGDRYYDFAKLYCSLLMPHPSIKDGRYSLRRSGGEIFADIHVPANIRDCRDIFESWLTNNGYSIGRTAHLAAIVMLNMAPLHEHPLDQWLYYTSKNLLSQIYPSGVR